MITPLTMSMIEAPILMKDTSVDGEKLWKVILYEQYRHDNDKHKDITFELLSVIQRVTTLSNVVYK